MASVEASSQPWLWSDGTWREKVDRVRAGRSLKPARWKDGARMAVAVSFDADHETIDLRNGAASICRMSQGQYGARAGMPRIRKLLAAHGVPASVFMPAVSAMINAEEARALAAEGHEIGIHGWIHEFNSQLNGDTERSLTMKAADTLEKITGIRPVGMRTASWDFTPATLSIAREMGLLYDSSLMADDEPYELLEDGVSTGMVEIPVEWIRDDAPYFNMDRGGFARPYGGPAMVLDLLLRELDMAYEEYGLFQVTFHPHHLGHRSRIFILDELLRAAKAKGDVWFATHADIASYCKSQADASA